MVTYATSSRNQIRTPSGAVGEPPDGPGGMATLAQDIDDRLGNAGAETFSTFAAINVPSARRFVGKRVYLLDEDTVYRWNGTAWIGWESGGWIAFAPADGMSMGSGGARYFHWRYASGRVKVRGRWLFGTSGVNIPAGGVTLPLPRTAVVPFTGGWFHPVGVGSFQDVSTSTPYPLTVLLTSSTAAAPYTQVASGAYASDATVTASVPVTLGSGDYIGVEFEYDSA